MVVYLRLPDSSCKSSASCFVKPLFSRLDEELRQNQQPGTETAWAEGSWVWLPIGNPESAGLVVTKASLSFSRSLSPGGDGIGDGM